ncbi:MAG: GNAT family N-acetyltransferase [Actinomycetota bacterium]|nr:GNAT family N-acetyltransferase [Actinomycetota bacterium]
MDLVDLPPGDERWAEALPVLQELRPHLTGDSFGQIYAEGHPQGLRFTAAYDRGSCVGVAGWRLVARTFTGRDLYVDDLVTTGAGRSRGVGRALLGLLEDRARAAGCTSLHLDSGVARHDAHRFYLRERMAITSHHFSKQLT